MEWFPIFMGLITKSVVAGGIFLSTLSFFDYVHNIQHDNHAESIKALSAIGDERFFNTLSDNATNDLENKVGSLEGTYRSLTKKLGLKRAFDSKYNKFPARVGVGFGFYQQYEDSGCIQINLNVLDVYNILNK